MSLQSIIAFGRSAAPAAAAVDYGPVHTQPGQPVDMKSDFAPAKIALAAGATGSVRRRQQIAENSINVHLPLELAWLTVHRPYILVVV